jgi:hypothetical protein
MSCMCGLSWMLRLGRRGSILESRRDVEAGIREERFALVCRGLLWCLCRFVAGHDRWVVGKPLLR